MDTLPAPSAPIDAETAEGQIATQLWRRARLQLAIMLLVIAVAAGGAATLVRMLVPQIAEHLVLGDKTELAQIRGRRLISTLENGTESFVVGRLTERDISHINYLLILTENYRMKFFAHDGRIFWSSRIDEIGDVQSNDDFARVQKGEVVAKMVSKSVQEIDHWNERGIMPGEGVNRRVVEIYVPYLDASGAFLGAVELYKDVTEQVTAYAERLAQSMTVLVALGSVAAYAVFVLITRQNTRRLIRVEAAGVNERESLAAQQRLAREMALLGNLNEWLQSSSSLDELFRMIARFLTHLLPGTEGAIYIYSNSRDVLDGGASWGGATLHDQIHPKDCWALRRGRTYHFDASPIALECEHARGSATTPYLCFPILAHGETVGLIHLRSSQAGAAGQRVLADHRRLAQMCAEQISMAIANVRMRDTLQEQASRDPLTGLFNRRLMGEHLRSTLRSCERAQRPLSVLALDVDHFKRFNDTFGHDAGDFVLTEVARVLREAVDGDELAARPGGEEFAVVLPGIAKATAMARADRLRATIAERRITYADKALPSLTVSIGVASYPEDGATVHDLLSRADAALYEAKNKGRNRVLAAGATTEAACEAACEPDGSGAWAAAACLSLQRLTPAATSSP